VAHRNHRHLRPRIQQRRPRMYTLGWTAPSPAPTFPVPLVFLSCAVVKCDCCRSVLASQKIGEQMFAFKYECSYISG
jgi:hypothetical protein